MAHEHNDLGGGHSPRELDIQTGTFVADSVATLPRAGADREAAAERVPTTPEVSDPTQRSRHYGFLTFVGIAVYLGWRFLADARASA